MGRTGGTGSYTLTASDYTAPTSTNPVTTQQYTVKATYGVGNCHK